MLLSDQNFRPFHVAESKGALKLRSRLPPIFAVLISTLLYFICAVVYQCLTEGMTRIDWQGVALLTSLLVGGCCTSHCRDCIYFDANRGLCTIKRIRYGFRTGHQLPLNGVVSACVDSIEPIPGSKLPYGRIELLTIEHNYTIGVTYSPDIESIQLLCDRINRYLRNQHGMMLA